MLLHLVSFFTTSEANSCSRDDPISLESSNSSKSPGFWQASAVNTGTSLNWESGSPEAGRRTGIDCDSISTTVARFLFWSRRQPPAAKADLVITFILSASGVCPALGCTCQPEAGPSLPGNFCLREGLSRVAEHDANVVVHKLRSPALALVLSFSIVSRGKKWSGVPIERGVIDDESHQLTDEARARAAVRHKRAAAGEEATQGQVIVPTL